MDDPKYKGVRLKQLKRGTGYNWYPPHHIDESIVDVVGVRTFIKSEPKRLPYCIGTQFGVYPDLIKLLKLTGGNMTVAVLGISILSGAVAGLSIRQYSNGQFTVLDEFRNDILNQIDDKS